MNEILRRALLDAGLDEADVAARMEVDPKTVHRWLEGRLPYARHRWALADLLKLKETDLWPRLRSTSGRPDEVLAIYPHRSSIPCEFWQNLFASAEHAIDILDYSSLFLARDPDVIRALGERSQAGVRVRIALRDPDVTYAKERNERASSDDVAITGIREALNTYLPLRKVSGIEIRLHRIALYNSLYRADEELFCNLHAYGISAEDGPVTRLRCQKHADIAQSYLAGFEGIWSVALPQH